MGNSLFCDGMIGILEKSLDATSLRNRVIANNMANINTPGFQRSKVSFEEKLNQALNNKGVALSTTNPGHFPGGNGGGNMEPQVVQETGTTQRQDGNNVNLETELSEMGMNIVLYRFLVQELNTRLGNLSYVINEGRR